MFRSWSRGCFPRAMFMLVMMMVMCPWFFRFGIRADDHFWSGITNLFGRPETAPAVFPARSGISWTSAIAMSMVVLNRAWTRFFPKLGRWNHFKNGFNFWASLSSSCWWRHCWTGFWRVNWFPPQSVVVRTTGWRTSWSWRRCWSSCWWSATETSWFESPKFHKFGWIFFNFFQKNFKFFNNFF